MAACRISKDELKSAEFRASCTAILKAVETGERAYWTGGIATEVRSQSMELFGLRSIICEPLKVHNKVLGVLYLDSTINRKFSDDHRDIGDAFDHFVAGYFVKRGQESYERVVRTLREYWDCGSLPPLPRSAVA